MLRLDIKGKRFWDFFASLDNVGWLIVLGVMVLKDSISVYIGPSPREREKEKRNDRREIKCPNNPHPHPLQAQLAFALLLPKLIGRPGTGSLSGTIALPPMDNVALT